MYMQCIYIVNDRLVIGHWIIRIRLSLLRRLLPYRFFFFLVLYWWNMNDINNADENSWVYVMNFSHIRSYECINFSKVIYFNNMFMFPLSTWMCAFMYVCICTEKCRCILLGFLSLRTLNILVMFFWRKHKNIFVHILEIVTCLFMLYDILRCSCNNASRPLFAQYLNPSDANT